MNQVKRFNQVLFAVTLFALSLNSKAYAQNVERYIQAGSDDAGTPIMLDTQSIKGTTYKLYQPYGNGLTELKFKVSCGEARLFSTGFALYNSVGQVVTQDKTTEEVVPREGSAAANAMRFVCQRIGARGW
ncbi:hypothetical protein LC605_25690 [Nostoc sp. CHAB 5836]|uniref:hypothetical protein n=1 Tax=Nostoc sp. CHAB 5836 TaxID=2780404 RepID=UPI001E3AF363|nr:hypothetical protein [Nostoc sp. CHAB 5836]MCC5618416.1 hypothetical protein [Nostoc sp. CHAB 5836]